MKFWVRVGGRGWKRAFWCSSWDDLAEAKREARAWSVECAHPSLVMQSDGFIRSLHTTASCGNNHSDLAERCEQHNAKLRKLNRAKALEYRPNGLLAWLPESYAAEHVSGFYWPA